MSAEDRAGPPRGSEAPKPGALLVATPSLLHPEFAGTVVLLLDVGDDGALGVVLNRPSPLAVAELLPAWGPVVCRPRVLFHGGPVETNGALAVGLANGVVASGLGFSAVEGALGLVDLDASPEELGPRLSTLRVFAGYAGWGADQLQREITEGSWYVVPGESGDAFGDCAAPLRRRVLRRQPGELAWLSTRPVDPRLN